MARARRTILALALLVLAGGGCRSYLQPYDRTPLPARTVETQGGARLEAADGELALLPAARDVGAMLGVALEDGPGGVTVVERLRKTAPLLEDDRIVLVAALLPFDAAAERRRVVARMDEKTRRHVTVDIEPPAQPEPPVARSFAELRRKPGAHEVRAVADLTGYTAGVGWAVLDLGVRRGGEELVIRAKLVEERRPVEAKSWRRAETRALGIDVVSLEDWPPERLPAHATPRDLLVTRVAKSSRVGLAGLRPLDVVKRGDMTDPAIGLVAEHHGVEEARLRVVHPDGAEKEIPVAAGRREPVDVWFPFLLSYQDDGFRSHVGLGPLDMLLHFSSEETYEADMDRYDATRRYSFLTTLQVWSQRTAGGKTRDWRFDPISVDSVRMQYFEEWAGGGN